MTAPHTDNLPRLQPAPDAARPGIGVVHLGPGAFFRAHGALYLADAMAASGGDWGVLGVSLRSADIRDRLAPQGFAYTAVEVGPKGERPRLVEVLQDVRVAPENPEAVLEAMADPAVHIVSLTVTEKGYCHAPATGRLDRSNPDIAHDLAEPLPRSAPGYIVRALQRRRDAGLPPVTVLSCDNLPDNGRLLRGVVLEMAQELDPALAEWIADEGAFPSTMVDGIVPATRDEDIERLARTTGRLDLAPVFHEPFRQWAIEDHFVPGPLPDLTAAGAQIVADVRPFEMRKLRMLNGSHSALAYLGYLAGHATVSEAAFDPPFAGYLDGLWHEEVIPTITPPEGDDLGAFAAALMDRFRNPGLRHRTWQIAMDGSQKLPQRILGTIADNTAAGRPSPRLALAVAGWMVYVAGTDEAGQPIDVRDPLAGRLRALCDAAPDPADRVAALLSVDEMFPPELASDAGFRDAVTSAHAGLLANGARAEVEKLGR